MDGSIGLGGLNGHLLLRVLRDGRHQRMVSGDKAEAASRHLMDLQHTQGVRVRCFIVRSKCVQLTPFSAKLSAV